MIKSHRLLLAASFACLLPLNALAYSEAPVVDDSENFAMLDEQQAAIEQPVARGQIDSDDSDEEPALANDTLEASSKGDNAKLLDKLQGLQQEVQELRGQLEVQSHDLKLLQQQQLAFYKDLDARIHQEPAARSAKNEPVAEIAISHPAQQQVTAEITTPTVRPQAVSIQRTNPADEQISYLAAYELVKNKQYDDALVAMQTFTNRYPQGGYSANAQYWLGELYMVKKDYPQAMAHFEVVLQQFPSSSKSAASMLKIGYALVASGKKEDARAKLQQVVKNYPDTNTAQLATSKLETLGS